MTKDIDVSKKIAAMVLEGCTMTNNHCPICSTILVVTKDNGRSYCCSCSAYLVTPEQAGKLQLRASSQSIDDFLSNSPNVKTPVVLTMRNEAKQASVVEDPAFTSKKTIAAVDPEWDDNADIEEDYSSLQNVGGAKGLSKSKMLQTIRSKFDSLKQTVLSENNAIAAKSTPKDAALTTSRAAFLTSVETTALTSTPLEVDSFVNIGPPDWGLPQDSSPLPSPTAPLEVSAPADSFFVADKNESDVDSTYLDSDSDDTETASCVPRSVYTSALPLSYDITPLAPTATDSDSVSTSAAKIENASADTLVTLTSGKSIDNRVELDMDLDWEKFFDKDPTLQSKTSSDKPVQSVDDILAERMLNRWSLLAHHCPQCGIPMVGKQGRIECVVCGEEYSIDHDGELHMVQVQGEQITASVNHNTMSDAVVHDDMDEVDRYFAAEATRSRTSQASSQLLGQRMLEGWTMLGETCANSSCVVPLLRQKTTGIVECVSCGNKYTEATDVAEGQQDEENDQKAQKEPITIESPQPSVKSDPTQASLLSAFERARAEQLSYSPAVSDFEDYDGCDDEEDEMTDAQIRALLESPELERKAQRSREVSAKLSEQMAQGFRLSSLFCCDCHTPLLESEDTRMFCVGCGAKYMSEQKYAQKLARLNQNEDVSDDESGSVEEDTIRDSDEGRKVPRTSLENTSQRYPKEITSPITKKSPRVSGYVSLADLQRAEKVENGDKNVKMSEKRAEKSQVEIETETVKKNQNTSLAEELKRLEDKVAQLTGLLATSPFDQLAANAQVLKSVAEAYLVVKSIADLN